MQVQLCGFMTVIYVIERKCLQCVHVWNHEVCKITDTDFIEVLKCSSNTFYLNNYVAKSRKMARDEYYR
jgi:hypothetical protein